MTAANEYPLIRLISAITQANPGVVTFTEDHGYRVGQILSFRIPPAYGMAQLANQQATVIAVTDTTVTIDIDTYTYNAYVYPVADSPVYPPNTVPVASGINPDDFVKETNLQCAFDRVRVA